MFIQELQVIHHRAAQAPPSQGPRVTFTPSLQKDRGNHRSEVVKPLMNGNNSPAQPGPFPPTRTVFSGDRPSAGGNPLQRPAQINHQTEHLVRIPLPGLYQPIAVQNVRPTEFNVGSAVQRIRFPPAYNDAVASQVRYHCSGIRCCAKS